MAGFFEEDHACKAHNCARKGVKHTEQPVEEQTCQHDSYNTDSSCVPRAEFIQRHDGDYVCYAKFDAGNTRIVWYNCFDIRNDQSQCGHEADPGDE